MIAQDLTPIEELGKNLFFDTKMSIPNNKQGCVSCHEPNAGWADPDPLTAGPSDGAHPGAAGTLKAPSAGYAFISPVFEFLATSRPGGASDTCENLAAAGLPLPGTCFVGGLFWNGRAEGYGAEGGEPVGAGAMDSVTAADIGVACPGHDACAALGPLADQATGPFVNPNEHNNRMKKVCQRVKTAPYKGLYAEVWGGKATCQQEDVPLVYSRVAVSIAAYEMSTEVNPFASAREACLAASPDDMQGCSDEILSVDAKAGHAMFYSLPFGPGQPTVEPPAGCAACHSNGGANQPGNVYTDSSYHALPLPYNPRLRALGVEPGDETGLSSHVAGVDDGEFKTTTLLNVAKGESKKHYMHNGYFDTLKQVVHFYNTSRDPAVARCPGEASIDEIWVQDTDLSDGVDNSQVVCWPEPEFADGPFPPPNLVGNLDLTSEEEDQLVAYMRALSDQ